eukprot:6458595-Amphidinium_carterae.1
MKEHVALARSGISPEGFLASVGGLWELVLPKASVQTLLTMPATASWDEYKSELYDVVASGSLGRQLFSFAVADMVALSVSELMAKMRAELYSLSSVTVDAVTKLRKKYGDELEQLPQLDTLKHPREVSIVYRDHTMRLSVSSEYDELALVVAAAVKSVAVDCGQLTSLPAEDVFCEKSVVLASRKVEPGLVSESMNAR